MSTAGNPHPEGRGGCQKAAVDAICEAAAIPEWRARPALEAAAPILERSIRDLIAASLRRAAAGRREYAGSAEDGSESRPLLLKSAEGYESAARIVEDPRSIMGVIPSWRWTAEEDASIRSSSPAGAAGEDEGP